MSNLAERLAELSRACWERGRELPRLAMRKLFEKDGEAYAEWNHSLAGYEPPHAVIGPPFATPSDLSRSAGRRKRALRSPNTECRLQGGAVGILCRRPVAADGSGPFHTHKWLSNGWLRRWKRSEMPGLARAHSAWLKADSVEGARHPARLPSRPSLKGGARWSRWLRWSRWTRWERRAPISTIP
jgi:hypothetical protein